MKQLITQDCLSDKLNVGTETKKKVVLSRLKKIKSETNLDVAQRRKKKTLNN